MYNNFLRLVFGGSLGTFSTFLNVKLGINQLNDLLTLSSGIFALISAAFTCTYLYWQIRKIRKDLKK